MDLQTTFYTLGIIFMSLSILLFVSMLVLVFYIWRKVSRMQQFIEGKIDAITSRPAELAGEIGASLVNKAVKKAKDFLEEK